MLIASNLFAAGGETTARLLGTMLRYLGERPELQQQLRDERSRIPSFVEETLRLETPLHAQFRLARVRATIGGVDLPAGTTVMVLNGAANHDPRQFDDPDELRLDRVNGRQHLGFGFGIHTCAGAPLARAEARVSLERILDRMGDIRISEAAHGPAGARRYEYSPIYLLPRPRAAAPGVHAIDAPVGRDDRDGGRAGRVVGSCGARCRQHDEQFRDELRAWLARASPPDVDIPTTPEEAEALREWHRTLHAGRLGRDPLAGRVRRARRVAGADRDLQPGARARRRAAAARTRRPQPRRADVDGARHRGATPARGSRGSSRATTSGVSCSANPTRAATSPASRRAPRSATASTS